MRINLQDESYGVSDSGQWLLVGAYHPDDHELHVVLSDDNDSGQLNSLYAVKLVEVGGVTNSTYDDNGNQKTLTDPNGNTTTWTYDGLDRVIEEKNSLDDSRSFGYDANGNLTKSADRNERVTRYDYDRLNRRTAERWRNSGDTADVRTLFYSYDANGRLASVGDWDGSSTLSSYSYQRDNLGRITNTYADFAGLADEVETDQGFDANSNRLYLSALTIYGELYNNEYEYDAKNRITSIQQFGSYSQFSEKRVDFTYNAAGQYESVTRYADLAGTQQVVQTLYSYDDLGRLKTLWHAQDSTAFADEQFQYDELNRLVGFQNWAYADEEYNYYENSAFSYDNSGQLTGSSYDYFEDNNLTYTYDSNGNRTQTTTGAATSRYDVDPNNQIAGDGTFTYTYDDEGNLLTKTRVSGASADDHLTEYTWDYHNRLTQVTLKNNSGTVTQRIEYSYDAFDRLIGRKKFIGTSTTASLSQHFIYDGNQVILMLDDSAAVQQRYLWGPSVDMLLAQEDGSNNVRWALGDHENSTSDWISYDAGTETTSFVDHSQFDAFGNRMNTPTVESIFGWTGRFVDADTGLQWNGSTAGGGRWYDPHQGRWMSEDAIEFKGDLSNIYRYAGNDPLNAVDPSGRLGEPTTPIVAPLVETCPSFLEVVGVRILGPIGIILGGPNTTSSTDEWPPCPRPKPPISRPPDKTPRDCDKEYEAAKEQAQELYDYEHDDDLLRRRLDRAFEKYMECLGLSSRYGGRYIP